MESRITIPEMKNILLIARTLSHFIENHLAEHRKQYIEKRTLYVLNLIEKSIEVLDEKPNIIDLFEISSLIIPMLNTPDYLFKKILSSLDNFTATNDNKPKIIKFVNKLLEKMEPKYTFNIYLKVGDLEFNDKMTEHMLEIMKKLIYKFKESNLLSYVLLNTQIASHRNLVEAIYTSPAERKGNHLKTFIYV